jgi:hypothetical protein
MQLHIPKKDTVFTMNGLDLRKSIQQFVLERTQQYAEQDAVYRESVHRLSESMSREVLDSVTNDILGDGHSNGSYSYLTDQGFHENYWNASFVVRDPNNLTFSVIEKDEFLDADENLTRSCVFYVVNVSEYDYNSAGMRPRHVVKSYHIPVEVLLELQQELYKITDEILLMWEW